MEKSKALWPSDHPPLFDAAWLRARLARSGLRLQRGAGQHFLVCERVTAATIAALQGGPRLVTELGAGLGALTLPLLAHGYTVRAVERDQRLAAVLRELTPPAARGRLELIADDLRQARWERDELWQLAGNIPYQLSGYIFRRLTQLSPPPERAVLLLQQEVGQRIVAQAPRLQLLGLAVQLWGTARVRRAVPAACFWPVPQVDSCLLALKPHTPPKLPQEERERVVRVAARFFRSRRKQMGGVLRRHWSLSVQEAERRLSRAGIAAQQRPQEITPAQWISLAKTLT